MNNKLRHVMIDIETMGVTPDAAIVSIGAVVFDPRYGEVSKNTFYEEFDWKEQNRLVDPQTLEWWQGLPPSIKEALEGLEDLKTGLTALAKWLPKDCKVWGNGPVFDIAILENAYIDLGLPVPWNFWNVRDCRTILDMYESRRGGFSKSANRKGLHNALQDAIFQAKYVTMMWSKLLKDK